MDSRSAAVHSENNQISELSEPNIDDADVLDLLEEAVPLILSSEIRDVFPSIAKYLDIKSYMKLAMARKAMYKRCLEDERVKIEIQDGELQVAKKGRLNTIDFKSSNVSMAHTAQYLAALRLLPCNLHLQSVNLKKGSNVDRLRQYLAQLNVTSIKNMSISDRTLEWTELFPLVEDFHLDSLYISFFVEFPAEHVGALLQLKISSLVVESFIDLKILLELDAPVTDITLKAHPDIPLNVFQKILLKIQTSSLNKLNLRSDSFNWDLFQKIPFATDAVLPEDRPLVFSEDGNYISDYEEEKIYKVLHLDGSVTKCVVVDAGMTITKCEKSELPSALKSDEDVANDMRKWLPKVSCSKKQYQHFANTLILIDASHNGPLPDERPLFFFDSSKEIMQYGKEHYWMLDEDGSLKKYTWSESMFSSNNYATSKVFDLKTTWPEECNHASLGVYILKTMLQNGRVEGSFSSDMEGKGIRSCLSGFKTIPFDYWGPLPGDRPLFFERVEENVKENGGTLVALLEIGEIVQCSWRASSSSFPGLWGSAASFTFGPYLVNNVPPVLISKEIFKNMLGSCRVRISRMELDVFLGAFEGFKTLSMNFEGSLPEERPLVFKPADNEDVKRWFLKNHCVTKCEWNEGEVSLSSENPREFSLNLTKELVKKHLKKECRYLRNIYFLDFDVFRSYFSDFKTISYDFSSMQLPEDRPLIFEKTEVKEGCNLRDEEGRDLLWRICLVDEEDSLFSITWGEKEPREVAFHGRTEKENIPPSMKSADRLKCLLERKCDGPGDEWKAVWYGDLADFQAYFKDYVLLPYEHEGPLPEGAPFIFYERLDDSSIHFTVWFPREDGAVIKCSWSDDHVEICFTTNIPSALRRRRA